MPLHRDRRVARAKVYERKAVSNRLQRYHDEYQTQMHARMSKARHQVRCRSLPFVAVPRCVVLCVCVRARMYAHPGTRAYMAGSVCTCV